MGRQLRRLSTSEHAAEARAAEVAEQEWVAERELEQEVGVLGEAVGRRLGAGW